jgi:hypothetical protein
MSLFVSRCIEPFDPPRGDFDDLLVIEGLITDAPEPQLIRISRSFPLDTTQYIPENGATVVILDDMGNEYQLQSAGNGEYLTLPDFQGEPGRTYQLLVTTANEEMIQSDPVTMKKVPEIDSISWKVVSRLNDEGELIDGVQIYVNTHDPENQTWNYRWQWKETWEFNARYHSYYQWSANGMVEVRPDNIYTCWTTKTSGKILIESSSKLTNDIIFQYPLHYVSSTSSNRLSKKYSILVKQYALSDAAWFFWQQMEKMNQNMGTIFAPQPTAVVGNLHNINIPAKTVIGYFDASGIKEKRIFISKEDLGDMDVYSGYKGCTLDTLLLSGIPKYPNKQYYIPVIDVLDERGFTIGYWISSKRCADCTMYGVNTKPDFWE